MVQSMVPNQDLPIVPLKRSLIDHSLAMSSFMSSSPTPSFSTLSKLLGSWDRLLVGVRRSSTDYRILSWTKTRIFHVSPQEASLTSYSRVENMGGTGPFWYRMMINRQWYYKYW